MTEESSSSSKPSSIPENNGRCSNKLRTDFCTTQSSPMDSATQKMSDTITTHPSNAKHAPTKSNLAPSVLSVPPHCSGREQRASMHDNDSCYLVTLYGSWHTWDLGGRERDKWGEAGSSEGEDKVMNVIPTTNKSAKAAVLKDPIS